MQSGSYTVFFLSALLATAPVLAGIDLDHAAFNPLAQDRSDARHPHIKPATAAPILLADQANLSVANSLHPSPVSLQPPITNNQSLEAQAGGFSGTSSESNQTGEVNNIKTNPGSMAWLAAGFLSLGIFRRRSRQTKQFKTGSR